MWNLPFRAQSGGPRKDYGTLFENQPDHVADPDAALRAIGSPTLSTATPESTQTLGLFAWAILARWYHK